MVKYEIEIDCPEGWKPVAFREPRRGDYFLTPYGECMKANVSFKGDLLIVEPTKTYREPVLPADYGKQVEFSDDGVQWFSWNLEGWHKDTEDDDVPWASQSGSYKHCRIEVTQ
jgi:hypothetical protein